MNSLQQIEFLQSKTLASLVQDEIIRMIKDGELSSGAKLVEASFTNRLNISRAGVREAFRALEEAGLVRLEKNRGAYVRDFSKTEAVELFEMRSCLEEMAGRRLAEKITDQQIEELQRLNERLSAFAKKSAIDQYYPLNITFHDRFVEFSHHAALRAMYRRLTDQMHLLRRRGYESGDGLLKSHAEHAAILDALASREADAIVLAIKTHSMNGMMRYLAL